MYVYIYVCMYVCIYRVDPRVNLCTWREAVTKMFELTLTQTFAEKKTGSL